MYVFIVPNVAQYVPEEQNSQSLPEAYGPYLTSREAIGAAIDWFRCSYDKEPVFTFLSFGEHAENTKLLICKEDGLELGATINKLY